MGSLALRPGDSLTIPWMALSVGFIRFVSSTDATQATKLPTLALMGLTPIEHVSLPWTHSLPINSVRIERALILRVVGTRTKFLDLFSGCVPEVFQKSKRLAEKGFLLERKQKPRIGASP